MGKYGNNLGKSLLSKLESFQIVQITASIKDNKWHDITHWGIRASIGAIFIVHGLKKFNPSWEDLEEYLLHI